MMFTNIKIQGIGIYKPKRTVRNDYFINHFANKGIEVESLMNHLGKNKRYLVDKATENSITMAIEASKMALDNAKVSPEELDGIVFVTNTPEYLSPANARIISNKLGCKNAHFVFDMNNDCIGFITAMDIMIPYVKSNSSINKLLIVSSLNISSVVSENDPITYPNVADGSSAVILQKTEEAEERGVLCSNYFTDSNYYNTIVNPVCGYSKIHDMDVPIEDKKLIWNPFDFSFLSDNWTRLIREMLDKRELQPHNVDHYLFSQFSKTDIIETARKLEVDFNKDNFTYIGDEYGYTGPTSPILALYHAVKENKVKEDSYAVLCSVAAGYTMGSILYKF